jgi:hypothetical protein
MEVLVFGFKDFTGLPNQDSSVEFATKATIEQAPAHVTVPDGEDPDDVGIDVSKLVPVIRAGSRYPEYTSAKLPRAWRKITTRGAIQPPPLYDESMWPVQRTIIELEPGHHTASAPAGGGLESFTAMPASDDVGQARHPSEAAAVAKAHGKPISTQSRRVHMPYGKLVFPIAYSESILAKTFKAAKQAKV